MLLTVKVKLFLCHTRKAFRVELAFFTMTLDRGDWSVSCSTHFNPGKEVLGYLGIGS